MMKAAPAPALIVTEPDLLFQFLVVALDAPSAFGGGHQVRERGVGWQGGQPVFGWFGFAVGPLDQEPLFRTQLVIAVGCRTPAKRERNCVLVPARHVTLRHCDAGKDRARSLTGTGL
jgi:hypothetical protein